MNETLEHHGILGMKWGVRRYQNKDGTWTKEGKEHRAEEKPLFTKQELEAAKNRDMDDDGDWAINDAMFLDVTDHYPYLANVSDEVWGEEFNKFCQNPEVYMDSLTKIDDYYKRTNWDRAKSPVSDLIADTDEYKKSLSRSIKLRKWAAPIHSIL